jgi:phosphoribosylpyrophosphate synthetase
MSLKQGDKVYARPKLFGWVARRCDDPSYTIVAAPDPDGVVRVRSDLLGIEVDAHVSELESRIPRKYHS